MTNQEFFEIVACFDRSTAQTMKLSTQEFTIELTRGGASAPAASAPAAAPAAAAAPVPAPQSSSSSIDAPLVGTFYAAPAPDQAPFVLPGDRVSKGQTVCLIEAMKMMSEVPAPCDCVIESVCKSNGELVAFGDPLSAMLRRVLIANRGEIALRVLRACRELGIETVAVYSQADADALHVQLAGQAVCIGPARAADSYLNQDALLTVAKATGCDGVHPGYGFLSENADFADACAAAGLTFIGPSGDAIRKAGSKSAARDLMRAAGVPVTPGSDGPVASVEEALTAAESVGYPVLLKASAGGGGRGIRRCDRPEDLSAAFAEAKAEAQACFGNDEMYLEKLVLRPRHIEFQVLADRYGNVIHLGDRDCSVQRRNQKLIEEAPARCLTPELRERMGAAAVKAAKAVGYENAGTVEFLLDPDREHFYFMEMNTRIQVEHGVTELVTGVDLVRQQLRIASGLALRLRQEDVTLQGHAIECRINAEDPVQGFRPCPGRVDFLHFPGGPGVRVDSCLYSGCELSPYYDSMAAKILAYAPTRMETIRRMRRCLEEFTLEGFPTNAELSYQILYHPEFILGECTTAFLDEHLSELLEFSRKLSESGVDA